MAALSDVQIRQIEQQLNARPEITQALTANAQRQSGRGGRLQYVVPQFADQRDAPSEVYRRFGITFPDAEDYNIVRDARSGQLRLDHHGYFSRNADWLVPVITFASAGVGSAIASAAGAGSSGAVPEIAVTGASSSAPIAAPTTAAGITGGTGAGAVAAGTGTGASIWNAAKTGAGAVNDVTHGVTAGNRSDILGTLGALIPLLIRRAQNGGSSGGGDSNSPFGGGEVSKEIAGLLNLQGQRLKDMMPVRQAALRLAMGMAPSAATSPRMNEAVSNASMPRDLNAQDPQVMAALQRFMGGA